MMLRCSNKCKKIIRICIIYWHRVEMPLPMPPALFSILLMAMKYKKLDGKDDHRNDEQEDRYPVDAVHVFHPLRWRIVRISFLKIEIFCYLPENAHLKSKVKIQNQKVKVISHFTFHLLLFAMHFQVCPSCFPAFK